MRRAINYMLDDEKGFKAFLTDGAIELSNNAAERMFRHIAMGRRHSALSLGFVAWLVQELVAHR